MREHRKLLEAEKSLLEDAPIHLVHLQHLEAFCRFLIRPALPVGHLVLSGNTCCVGWKNHII